MLFHPHYLIAFLVAVIFIHQISFRNSPTSLNDADQVKIYIPTLPNRFNISLPQYGPTTMYYLEKSLTERLRNDPRTVDSIQEADLIYIPLEHASYFHSMGWEGLSDIRRFIADAVMWTKTLPIGNKPLVAPFLHDHGSFLSPVKIRREVYAVSFMCSPENCLSCPVGKELDCKTILVPVPTPFVKPNSDQPRDIWITMHASSKTGDFRGKFCNWLKNVTDLPEATSIKIDGEWIGKKPPGGDLNDMKRSVFCLAPKGWVSWTVRLFEAVQAGCIPVSLSDEVRFPGYDELKHLIDLAIIRHPESEMTTVLDRLQSMSREEIDLRLAAVAALKSEWNWDSMAYEHFWTQLSKIK